MKAEKFSSLVMRQKNMKVELKDMEAHQQIVKDDTFKKEIKKEKDKKTLKNIEDIFDKGTNDKGTKDKGTKDKGKPKESKKKKK